MGSSFVPVPSRGRRAPPEPRRPRRRSAAPTARPPSLWRALETFRHDLELDGARNSWYGHFGIGLLPPRGPVSNSRSGSHSVNTSGLYSSLTSPNRARSASPARSTSVPRRGNRSCTRSRGTRRARRRRRAQPSRRSPLPPPPPRTPGPSVCPVNSSGTLISIHLPTKLPSDAGGAGGRRTPRHRAYTHGHRIGHTAVGGFALANATGLVPGQVREPRVRRVVRDASCPADTHRSWP